MRAFLATIIVCALLLVCCTKEKTGTCRITCWSSSSGALFSDEIFSNYTEQECEDQFNGTTSSLVPCTKEWTKD